MYSPPATTHLDVPAQLRWPELTSGPKDIDVRPQAVPSKATRVPPDKEKQSVADRQARPEKTYRERGTSRQPVEVYTAAVPSASAMQNDALTQSTSTSTPAGRGARGRVTHVEPFHDAARPPAPTARQKVDVGQSAPGPVPRSVGSDRLADQPLPFHCQ
jgi:hypothetical protein